MDHHYAAGIRTYARIYLPAKEEEIHRRSNEVIKRTEALEKDLETAREAISRILLIAKNKGLPELSKRDGYDEIAKIIEEDEYKTAFDEIKR